MNSDQQEAFLKHYTGVQLPLRRFVMAHVPDYHEAEDVLQKASLVLWKKYAEFTGEGSFDAWAFGVTKREVLHARRTSSRQRVLLTGDVGEAFEERLLATSAQFDQRRGHLNTCIERLPPTTRRALQAKYAEGLSSEALSKTLGIHADAVRALLYRARQAIAQCMEYATVEARSADAAERRPS